LLWQVISINPINTIYIYIYIYIYKPFYSYTLSWEEVARPLWHAIPCIWHPTIVCSKSSLVTQETLSRTLNKRQNLRSCGCSNAQVSLKVSTGRMANGCLIGTDIHYCNTSALLQPTKPCTGQQPPALWKLGNLTRT